MRSKVIVLLTLSFSLLSIVFAFPSAHGTPSFSWPLSNATQGENNTPCSNGYNYWNFVSKSAGASPIAGSGIVATDGSWTGTTVTSITFYLNWIDVGTVGGFNLIFGSFSTSDGHLITTFATVPVTSAPSCTTGGTPTAVTVSGSMVLGANQYVGVESNAGGNGQCGDGNAFKCIGYFADYRCGLGSLPAVTLWDGGLTVFGSAGNHCPIFGTVVFSSPVSTPPQTSAPTTVTSTQPVSFNSPIVNIGLTILAAGFIVYTAWEVEQRGKGDKA